jgi:Domain of unknown function (DUF3471)
VATDIYDHLLNGRLTGKLSLPKRVAPSGLGMAGVPPVAVPPLPAVSPIAPAALGDYTGMFSNPGYGDFVVSRSGNSLNISYYGWSWPLRPLSATSFLIKVPAFGTDFPVLVEFAADKSSFAATLVLHPQIPVPFVKR